MLDTFLPSRIDNTYRGHKLALVLFVLVVGMKLAIALGCLFNGYVAASSADGIPLATYSPACVQVVLSDFAMWGLSQVLIVLLCILALVRYRSAIPFMFALLLVEHLGRKWIGHVIPIVKTGSPPGFSINLVLLGVMVVGLALSLWRREKDGAPA